MYRTLQKLGDGVFGSVVKAYDSNTQQYVAIKTFRDTAKDETKIKEIQILRKLDHPNIIKLRDVIKQNRTISIVLDFSERNLLQYYTPLKEKNRKLCEEQIQSIVYQIADGLNYLHRNGFLHRDLKPENIMIQDNGVIKIIDFGQVTYQNQDHTEYVSTRWYRSPEQLQCQKYDKEIDIWALGCILAELYLYAPLYPGTSEIDQLHLIQVTDLNQYKKLIPQKPFELLRKMLTVSPKQRITAAEILQSEWLQHPFKFLPKELDCKADENKYLISPSQTPVKVPKYTEPSLFFKAGEDDLECAYVPSNVNTHKKRQIRQPFVPTESKPINLEMTQPDVEHSSRASRNYFIKPLLMNTLKKQNNSNQPSDIQS